MVNYDDERNAYIMLSYLSEPGDHAVATFIRRYGATKVAHDLMYGEPYNDHALTLSAFKRGRQYRELSIEKINEECQRYGISIVTPRIDRDYPYKRVIPLSGVSSVPFALYCIGDTSLLQTPSVSIVGARAATSYGEHVTGELVNGLTLDYTIVSGAAYGIDGTAHRAALSTGGKTIAVMAGGLSRAYPAGHDALIKRIQGAGLVVSEVPPGDSPTRHRFLQRNRIIAALGDASIVVEAGYRSGSLNEAGWARTLGRPVGAVPGPITSAASTGTHALIREHGAALITSSDDVRALLKGKS